MANITNYLNKIKTAVYGKEVRGAIHDAIKQVYDDASVNHGNANMEVELARGTYNTLNDRLLYGEQAQKQADVKLSEVGNSLLSYSLINRLNSKFILHRGCGILAPEQTRPAFEWAKRLGVETVEIDVWKTSDDGFIVHHDKTLGNLVSGTGNVEDYTVEQLKTLTVTGGENCSLYQNLHLMELKECLMLLKELGLKVLIDYKSYTTDIEVYQKLLGIIYDTGMKNDVMLSTYYANVLRYVRQIDASICIGCQTLQNSSEWKYFEELNVDFALISKGDELTVENINRVHSLNRNFIGCVINNADDINKYLEMGVDFIVGDYQF